MAIPLTTDVEALLAEVATLARRREPLPAGLRASGLAGAEAIAAALDRGDGLRAAFAGLLPPDHLDLISGAEPPLEQAALLVVELTRARRERRALLIDVLAYPLLSLAAMIGAVVVVATCLHQPLAWAWLWALPPGLALALLPMLALRSPEFAERIGWLGAWASHIALAGMYRRAALAARWRLTEADALPLLGRDLARVAPLLGTADAERHCRSLAEHHQAATTRAARRLALTLTVGIYLCGAGVFLAGAGGVVREWTRTMIAASVEPAEEGEGEEERRKIEDRR